MVCGGAAFPAMAKHAHGAKTAHVHTSRSTRPREPHGQARAQRSRYRGGVSLRGGARTRAVHLDARRTGTRSRAGRARRQRERIGAGDRPACEQSRRLVADVCRQQACDRACRLGTGVAHKRLAPRLRFVRVPTPPSCASRRANAAPRRTTPSGTFLSRNSAKPVRAAVPITLLHGGRVHLTTSPSGGRSTSPSTQTACVVSVLRLAHFQCHLLHTVGEQWQKACARRPTVACVCLCRAVDKASARNKAFVRARPRACQDVVPRQRRWR